MQWGMSQSAQRGEKRSEKKKPGRNNGRREKGARGRGKTGTQKEETACAVGGKEEKKHTDTMGRIRAGGIA